MAEVSEAVTAWGKCTIKMGASNVDGTMGSGLEDVGYIKEDTTKLEVEKGEKKQIFGEGHELLDERELEGSFKLSFTLIKASLESLAKMYGITIANDELPITRTTVADKRSYEVTPELIGAVGAKLPQCITSINPIMQTAEGWTVEIEAKSIAPKTEAACTLFKKAAPVVKP